MSNGDRANGDRAEEDAAWREIVEHFGERATLSDLDELKDPPQEPVATGPGAAPELPDWVETWAAEAFVPPEPPPLPQPTPARLMAWVGVLGAPLAVIVLIALSSLGLFVTPAWVTAVIVIGFLAGFGFLVSSMGKEPRDPYDDGARV